MKRNVSDNELVQQFINGNAEAMDILITRHQRKVISYVFNLVKNMELAEDIFQDTFVKVIHSLRNGSYKDDGKFIAWVLRIAHNLAIDFFRKEKRYKEVPHEQGEYDIFNDAQLVEQEESASIKQNILNKELKQLIHYLPQEQRSIVVMRLFLDMSFKEIAEHTEISINTALGRMRYAIINMRKAAEKHNIQITL